MPPSLQQLLKTMVDNGASDLHITRGSPPQIRLDGHLVKLKTDPLTSDDTKAICYSVMTVQQKAHFEENNELDMSFGIKGLARFRANIIVNQREVGSDTQSFKKALKSILRQDPDVVLVGELRDLETIEAALTIAETGHICFGTLHTNGAVSTINRIVDAFPAYQQPQIRAQLSMVLEGVMSQSLIPKQGGGRALVLEVMVPTPAIRNLIREDKIHQIYSQMQLGQAKYGMQTANQSLFSLYQKKFITMEHAIEYSSDAEELKNMIASGGVASPQANRPGAR
jgi:Tfp pilus assembly pilus retraction ATPase PilT